MAESELQVVGQPEPSNSSLVQITPGSSWGDEEDKVVPRFLVIKQASSIVLEKYPNGHFVDKAVGAHWQSINLVPLHIRLGRLFQSPYDEKNPGKRETYCRSADRIVPVTGDNRFKPPAADCNTCPYGKLAWANYDKNTKEGKPKNACEEDFSMLFIMEDNPAQPYWFQIVGQNRTIGEKMYTKLRERSKYVAQTSGRRPELFEYVITMTTERIGKYFLPKFVEIKEMSQEEAVERFGAAYTTFVTQRQNAFQARQQAFQQARENHQSQQQVEQQVQQVLTQQTVVEIPAQSTEAPKVDVNYLPPATKRTPGAAVRPVYTPQTPAANTPATIEAKAEIVSQEAVPEL